MKNLINLWTILLLVSICLSTLPGYGIQNVTSNTANSSHSNLSSDERIENIDATFGISGEWSFVLYSSGHFKSRVWYGYHGRYDTQYMKDITTSSGTYYITMNENGGKEVHFHFRNGKEKTGYLRYKRDKAILSYDGKSHEEIQ